MSELSYLVFDYSSNIPVAVCTSMENSIDAAELYCQTHQLEINVDVICVKITLNKPYLNISNGDEDGPMLLSKDNIVFMSSSD